MANQLENIIIDTAARAARHYLNSHGLTADVDTLAHCLRQRCKETVGEALRDAQEAIRANMHKVARNTFLASFVLAGIAAAKEAGRPRDNGSDELTA